jgi:hypothetical protein
MIFEALFKRLFLRMSKMKIFQFKCYDEREYNEWEGENLAKTKAKAPTFISLYVITIHE